MSLQMKKRKPVLQKEAKKPNTKKAFIQLVILFLDDHFGRNDFGQIYNNYKPSNRSNIRKSKKRKKNLFGFVTWLFV